MSLDVGKVRQFVKVSSGKIGVVMANEKSGGVFRGHCDLWFGEIDPDGNPIVRQMCIMDDWKTIESPLGISV
jgi:hypothetical protein